MGAALLLDPDRVHDIVSTLKRNLNIPITCKIRLLECPKAMLELCRRIEAAGASALAVHARYTTDRDRFRCMPDRLPAIISALGIPVIFNGDVFIYDEILAAKEATGASSVMIARGAQWNPSVFRKDGPLPVWDVLSQYLSLAEAVSNSVNNTKYVMMKMKANHCRMKGDMTFVKAKTFAVSRMTC
jgi:tRNA-dihydrouridine synthase 2